MLNSPISNTAMRRSAEKQRQGHPAMMAYNQSQQARQLSTQRLGYDKSNPWVMQQRAIDKANLENQQRLKRIEGVLGETAQATNEAARQPFAESAGRLMDNLRTEGLTGAAQAQAMSGTLGQARRGMLGAASQADIASGRDIARLLEGVQSIPQDYSREIASTPQMAPAGYGGGGLGMPSSAPSFSQINEQWMENRYPSQPSDAEYQNAGYMKVNGKWMTAEDYANSLR